MAFLGIQIQTKTRFTIIFSVVNPSREQSFLLRQALKMSTTQGKSKRPMCPTCSKPTSTCLCSRILTPAINNSVSVTILQHAQESNHPLNSTRIARLGLKNLTVATVSDVNFESRFIIRLREPGPDSSLVRNRSNGLIFHQATERGGAKKLMDESVDVIDSRSEDEEYLEPENSTFVGSGVNWIRKIDVGDMQSSLILKEAVNHVLDSKLSISDGVVINDEAQAMDENYPLYPNSNLAKGIKEYNVKPAIAATIGKYGGISYLSHIWTPPIHFQKPNFNKILDLPEAPEALSKGFFVKKLQTMQLKGSTNLKEDEEFELEVPPGSVLLFPSDKAVDISDLDDIGFEVKHLIVLDGTWAKAKRMYSENPWLNMLPHLKLEVDKISLYSEVRHQPKAGYLSTIESIVYALKAVGANHEGLNNLLDVFESMVGDQRRCKNERLSKLSPI